MGFLTPWFLAGVAMVGLPLWLHLLRQHRNTPRPFSSLMFFERRTQSSVKHRRLRHFLLLALRLAMLLLLALLFANPFVNRASNAVGGKKLVLIAVDQSFSMRYADHLEAAKQQAVDAANGLRAGDVGQVVALGNRVNVMTQPTGDKGALVAAIRAISPADAASSYAEFARFVRALPKSAGMPVEAHLFSDMQKTSMPPSFTDLRIPDDAVLELHSVAEKTEPNWAVESVTAPQRVYNTKKVRVQAVIGGYQTPATRRTVSLLIDGKTIESKTVDVHESSRATVEFVGLDASFGWNRGEVRIDSADRLSEDNHFYFAIERVDPSKTLFIHETRQTPAFFRTALDASAEGAFDVEAVTPEQAASMSLSKYAFITLAGVGPIPSGLEANLREFVNAGGGLLIALGPLSAGSPRVPVSGERILESRYSTRDGDRFQTAAQVDGTHPVLQHANGLDDVKFYQAVKVEEGNARVAARLSDGTPLLLDKRIGEGKALIFTSTFDNISNDFPLHASFVPFVENAARYLEGAEARVTAVSVGSYIELRRARDRGAAVEVLDPDGHRALDLTQSATAQNFQVEREGFFSVKPASGRQQLVAVNADRRESDLSVVPEETLALWRGGNGGRGSGPGGQESTPYSLWKYVLLALALVTLAESIVADRFTPAARDPLGEVRAASGKPVSEEARMAVLGKR